MKIQSQPFTYRTFANLILNDTLQKFTINNSTLWVKYIKLEFQSHYGNEHYCPVSLLRIFGSTMMDDLHILSTEEAPKEDSIKPDNKPKIKETYSKHTSISTSDTFKLFKDLTGYSTWNNMANHPTSFNDKDTLSDRMKSILKSHTETHIQDDTPPNSQENIFKSIMKRLLKLERNSTLYSKSIQEQTEFVDDMLGALDKDLNQKLLSIQHILNASIIGILKDLVFSKIDFNVNQLIKSFVEGQLVELYYSDHQDKLQLIQDMEALKLNLDQIKQEV